MPTKMNIVRTIVLFLALVSFPSLANALVLEIGPKECDVTVNGLSNIIIENGETSFVSISVKLDSDYSLQGSSVDMTASTPSILSDVQFGNSGSDMTSLNLTANNEASTTVYFTGDSPNFTSTAILNISMFADINGDTYNCDTDINVTVQYVAPDPGCTITTSLTSGSSVDVEPDGIVNIQYTLQLLSSELTSIDFVGGTLSLSGYFDSAVFSGIPLPAPTRSFTTNGFGSVIFSVEIDVLPANGSLTISAISDIGEPYFACSKSIAINPDTDGDDASNTALPEIYTSIPNEHRCAHRVYSTHNGNQDIGYKNNNIAWDPERRALACVNNDGNILINHFDSTYQ